MKDSIKKDSNREDTARWSDVKSGESMEGLKALWEEAKEFVDKREKEKLQPLVREISWSRWRYE